MRFKFPSLQHIFESALNSAKRFYVSLLFAICFTAVCLHWIGLDYSSKEELFYYKILMSLYIGFVFSIAVHVITEYQNSRLLVRLFLLALSPVITLMFYIGGAGYFIAQYYIVYFCVLALILHLVISVVPFLGERDNEKSFWQYNQLLLIRFLTSALYSAVLYGGLALALLAIDKLFNADLNWKVYPKLWVIVSCFFNPWFFLGGFPEKESVNQQADNYPRGLKFFTQYVLLTLVVVYLVILYAYGIKIVFTQKWPQGWLTYLLISFSIAGILSLLLIWPVRNKEGNRWIVIFSKLFYVALIPMLIMLSVAIYKRENDYGFTVLRNYLIVLNAWLAGITAYSLLSKRNSIKVIPASLALVGIISLYPVFYVAQVSQFNRLTAMLNKAKALQNGKVVLAKVLPVNEKLNNEIEDDIEYLINLHGVKSLQPVFSQNLDSLNRKLSVKEHYYGSYNISRELMSFITGFKYLDSTYPESKYFNFSGSNSGNTELPIKNYDSMLSFDWSQLDENHKKDEKFTFNVDQDNQNLVIYDGSRSVEINFSKLLDSYLDNLSDSSYKDTLNLSTAKVDFENQQMQIRVYFTKFQGDATNFKKKAPERKTEIRELSGFVLIHRK